MGDGRQSRHYGLFWWDTLRTSWIFCGWRRSLILYSTHHCKYHMGKVYKLVPHILELGGRYCRLLVSWFSSLYEMLCDWLLKKGWAFFGAIVNFPYEEITTEWSDHKCRYDVMRPLMRTLTEVWKRNSLLSLLLWLGFPNKVLISLNPWNPPNVYDFLRILKINCELKFNI